MRTVHFNLILQCYLCSKVSELFELIGIRNPFNLTNTLQTFIFTLVLKFRHSKLCVPLFVIVQGSVLFVKFNFATQIWYLFKQSHVIIATSLTDYVTHNGFLFGLSSLPNFGSLYLPILLLWLISDAFAWLSGISADSSLGFLIILELEFEYARSKFFQPFAHDSDKLLLIFQSNWPFFITLFCWHVHLYFLGFFIFEVDFEYS